VDAATKGSMTMKALSLSRPWLWAILEAGKRVENRDWQPPKAIIGKYIALHAAKSFDHQAFFTIERALEFNGVLFDLPKNPKQHLDSHIVGVARVTGFVEDSNRHTLPRDQRPWYMGKYGWLLEDVTKLETPIPCSGALSLWKMPPEVLQALEVQGPWCFQENGNRLD
jgi:hypothetical protein